LKRPLTPALQRALIIVPALGLSAVIAEAALRVAAFASPRIEAILNASPTVPDTVLGHRPSPYQPDADPAGFRNPERPASAVVVAIGDSQTWGRGVRRPEAWPHVFQDSYGLPTYSMAYGGYGPPHYLVLAREAMAELHPELLVIAVYSGNDLYDSWTMVYRRGQLASLRSTDPEIINEVSQAEREFRPIAEDWQRLRGLTTADTPALTGVRTALSRHLRIYGLARAARRSFDRSLDSVERTAYTPAGREQIAMTIATSEPGDVMPVRVGTVETVLTPRARLSAMDTSDARVREGLRISVAALLEISRAASLREVRVVVLMIPTKELVFSPWAIQANGPASEVMRQLEEVELKLWHELEAACRDHGVEALGCLGALRDSVADGRNPYFTDWDGHPSPHGHVVIARTLAESEVVRRLRASPSFSG
jgi:lysophospholipase L1-like esterase